MDVLWQGTGHMQLVVWQFTGNHKGIPWNLFDLRKLLVTYIVRWTAW